MKVSERNPPREFQTGRGEPIVIRDCARIDLEPDEQVTFVTPSGAEYDVARKAWGFYATPSLNGRLLNFGLRAALIRSFIGKYYVLVVERGREADFDRYLALEDNELVRWLDNDEDLAAVAAHGQVARRPRTDIHCMCGADRFTTAHMYFNRPEREVRFTSSKTAAYRRELFRCALCGHYISVHEMEGAAFYRGEYVDGTYGGADGIQRHFERIITLPPDRSDNRGRVARVAAFARSALGDRSAAPTVLDVGSGLCVFLNGMKAEGWIGTALDPDERAVRHAREIVGVAALCGDFMTAADLGRYDLITFNKVLEHVKDPIAMLARASAFLNPCGLVYVELPDGEAAAVEGFGREEFFIEHHHVFSTASTAILAARAGFEAIQIERLREPSSKFTLRAFLRPLS
jgi:SAM-dependent methyltransferase